jgi:hypothetical protein
MAERQCFGIRLLSLLVVLLVELKNPQTILSAAQSTYPIDWNKVPVQPTSVDVHNSEFGTCICDVTVGKCDLYCCCDGDCLEAEVASFGGHCLPETTATLSQSIVCIDRDELWATHRIDTTIFEDQICVKIDNSK